jgi:uncharacterized protein (TIGR02145 family)
MESQTLTQTVNVQVGGTTGSLANTGTSIMLITVIGLGLIIASLLIWYFGVRRANRKLSFNGLGVFIFMAFAVAGLTSNLSNVSAAPTLTLAANQNTINVTVPQGGGKANTTTTLTSGTTNPSGYELTADLAQPEPGISLSLSGGSIATSTPLNVGDVPLTLKTTSSSTTNDTTDVTLSFTVDSSVKSGTKELKLAYKVADNATSAPVTMQDLTADYCQNSMVTYDGTNESAVVSLNDPRGDGQTYRVAKLADSNCWMLDNLKLGSTTGTTALTPADSNINANFSLPQLVTTGTGDLDNPKTYGPVPGDTGVGATNYGYLYNWSAATAGESRTSHDETAGDAPYSICPANWRLPIGGEYNSGVGEFADLDRAFGGTGMYADSGEPNIAKWQHDGPFKGTFAGGWSEGFVGQGGGGYLWSSSAYPGVAGSALGALFFADGVGPGVEVVRDIGVGVRCLLN